MTTTTETLRPEVVADRQIAAAWATYYEARRPGERLLKKAADAQRNAGWFPSRRAQYENDARDYAEQARTALATVAPLMHAAIALDKALYTGWQRFFLVTDGHIHASTACHTLRISTSIGWLPDLSGLTEADAVAAHGPLLCTVCFPSAPVEWTVGKVKPERCEGSGKGARRVKGRYAECPTCHTYQSLTQYGAIRAHKPAKS